MTPEHTAHETRDAIVITTSGFMTDPACYARGNELGFEGMDFYVAGRGGVLGDTPADVVVAAFVYFNPAAIHAAWERSAKVMAPLDAARAFAQWGHAWAEEHFPDGPDYARLAELLGRIIALVPVAGVPLFAGWRALTEPANPKALSLQRMNVLRELRGGLHAAAILTVGLAPLEALVVRSPQMVPVFGWTADDVPADPAPFQQRWQLAEDRTDRIFGRHFGVLDEPERDELIDLFAGIKP